MAEEYVGVKFSTKFVNSKIPDDKRIQELVYWSHFLAEQNMTPKYNGGSSGNLSFRINKNTNHMIITASSCDLETISQNSEFTKVLDCNTKKMEIKAEGIRVPSSESFLHWAIYEKRKDIHAILHGHWPELLKTLNKMDIAETENEQEYGTKKLVNEVIKVIQNHDFIIMKNHGFLALGKTIAAAAENLNNIRKQYINLKEK